MDFQITIDENGAVDISFDKAETIINNLYLSLMVIENTFFQNPGFGMPDMRRKKNLETNAEEFKQRAAAATKWIVDMGRAAAITFETELDKRRDPHRLKYRCCAVQADGREISFEKYLEVV